MALKERLLNMIGIEPVRNIDVLLADLADLTPDDFVYMVLSRQSQLPERLDLLRCEDCKRTNGSCPAPGDDDTCPTTTADWLYTPAPEDRDTILFSDPILLELAGHPEMEV